MIGRWDFRGELVFWCRDPIGRLEGVTFEAIEKVWNKLVMKSYIWPTQSEGDFKKDSKHCIRSLPSTGSFWWWAMRWPLYIHVGGMYTGKMGGPFQSVDLPEGTVTLWYFPAIDQNHQTKLLSTPCTPDDPFLIMGLGRPLGRGYSFAWCPWRHVMRRVQVDMMISQ